MEYLSKLLAIWADEDAEAGIEESGKKTEKVKPSRKENIENKITCNFRFKNSAGKEESNDSGGDSASMGCTMMSFDIRSKKPLKTAS